MTFFYKDWQTKCRQAQGIEDTKLWKTRITFGQLPPSPLLIQHIPSPQAQTNEKISFANSII